MHRLQKIQQHLTGSVMSEAPTTTDKTEFLKDYIFFGHDTVNRVSFLRQDAEFITQAINHPSTKFIVFNNGTVYGTKIEKDIKVDYFSKSDISEDLINLWSKYNNDQDIKINDLFLLTFLGLDESKIGLTYKDRYSGVSYFAIDLLGQDELISKFNESSGSKLITDRMDIFKLGNFDASMFSHGKMYLDWLNRNRFCAGCGSKTLPVQGGTKLLCGSDVTISKCPVKSASVSNISFPRTDSVIITAITNSTYDKILLGRGKRFPMPMYSCIAGFVEPSETIEVAALREVWEETGVKANELTILKTQPWPYPANLMIGCVAFVEENGTNEIIHLGHDPELADAQWFETKDIKLMLEKKLKKDWFLPPPSAIAYHLIDHVVKKWEESNK